MTGLSLEEGIDKVIGSSELSTNKCAVIAGNPVVTLIDPETRKKRPVIFEEDGRREYIKNGDFEVTLCPEAFSSGLRTYTHLKDRGYDPSLVLQIDNIHHIKPFLSQHGLPLKDRPHKIGKPPGAAKLRHHLGELHPNIIKPYIERAAEAGVDPSNIKVYFERALRQLATIRRGKMERAGVDANIMARFNNACFGRACSLSDTQIVALSANPTSEDAQIVTCQGFYGELFAQASEGAGIGNDEKGLVFAFWQETSGHKEHTMLAAMQSAPFLFGVQSRIFSVTLDTPTETQFIPSAYTHL